MGGTTEPKLFINIRSIAQLCQAHASNSYKSHSCHDPRSEIHITYITRQAKPSNILVDGINHLMYFLMSQGWLDVIVAGEGSSDETPVLREEELGNARANPHHATVLRSALVLACLDIHRYILTYFFIRLPETGQPYQHKAQHL